MKPTLLTPGELLSLYAAGRRRFAGIEMDIEPYGDFSGCVLEGADFSGSSIVANFSHAHLQGSSFRNANLKTSLFTSADLRECDFRGAALCATLFEGAVMTHAQFAESYFHSRVLAEGEFPNW